MLQRCIDYLERPQLETIYTACLNELGTSSRFDPQYGDTMIQWAYFPQSGKATSTALAVIDIFECHQKEIDSEMEGRYLGQSFLPPKASFGIVQSKRG